MKEEERRRSPVHPPTYLALFLVDVVEINPVGILLDSAGYVSVTNDVTKALAKVAWADSLPSGVNAIGIHGQPRAVGVAPFVSPRRLARQQHAEDHVKGELGRTW